MYKLIALFLFIFFSTILLFYSSCRSKKLIPQAINIENQALLVLDPPLTLINNSDSTYVLCIGNGNSRSNPLSKSYCVIDKMGSLVLGKKQIHGQVSWLDNETIMLEEMPRALNKREGTASVIKYFKIKEANANSKER